MKYDKQYMNTLFGPEEVDVKECSKCKKILPLSAFSNANGAKYPRAECKKCSNFLARQIDGYRKLPRPKDYRCPICLRTEEQCVGLGGNAGPWCIDHDHATGEFRGWLCHQCNRGLGFFKDDVAMFERAIAYLQRRVMICESED